MRQCKIMTLITWYLVYLFQVEICGKRLELHAETGDIVRHQSNSKFQSYLQPTTDSFNLRRFPLLPLGRKSVSAVLSQSFNSPLDIKSIDRTNYFAPLPERRLSKKTSNAADSLRELRYKIHVERHRTYDQTISSNILPPVLPVKFYDSPVPNKRLHKLLGSNRDRRKHVSLSGPNPASGEFKSEKVSRHLIVKRSNREDSSSRIPKSRTTGLKVSNVENSSGLNCPALRLTMRTIVTCTNGTQIGSKCLFQCAPGFKLTGNRRSRRCRTNESRHKYIPYWSGKEKDFQCAPICRNPPNPEYGSHKCHWQERNRGRILECTTECKRGFRIAGTQQNTCLENGGWQRPLATCKVDSARNTKRIRFKFQEHQSLTCGEVHSLAFFRKDETFYLVAGDKMSNVIRVYRWLHEKFNDVPCQTFYFLEPDSIQALTAPDGSIWLMVAGSAPDATLYRFQENCRFELSHTLDGLGAVRKGPDAIGFAELQGEFYRCYGRNRRETPVVVVHKLQDRHSSSGNRDVFKRIIRKKMPGEKVHQCSLYSEGNSLYTVLTVNKRDGRGRILIGHLAKKRMKTVDVVSGHKLWKVSDSVDFTADGERYIAVSQATPDGRCLVYKRHWFNQPPAEKG